MIFNQSLVRRVLMLQIPTELKLAILLDPVDVVARIPQEVSRTITAALVGSIRETFLVGLFCTGCCTVATVFVPIKRLVIDDEQPKNMKDEEI